MHYTREDACGAWLANARLPYAAFSRLMHDFSRADAVYDALVSSQEALDDYLDAERLTLLRSSADKASMHAMLLSLQKADVGVLSVQGSRYPDMLRNISDPPPVLFYKGDPDCLQGKCITMVGSRKASPAGIAVTQKIARDFGEACVTVVSGMAVGIDASAHTGCMDGGSPTAAVLGCGLDVDYPAEHSALKRRLLNSGGVMLSEYPLGTRAYPGHFPVRNRLLSGLSRVVVMMECSQRSGSLSTVQHALDQGREVYAYPGDVGTPWAEGAHQLLREGANYFATAEDILSDMGWKIEKQAKRQSAKSSLPPLTEVQRRVLTAVTSGECSFDQLAAGTGLGAPELSGALTMLQLMGLVKSLPGKMYAKV